MPHTASPSFYSKSTKLKAFFLAAFGTIVEYYDYALYGFCAHHIAQTFFPNDDPAVSLIKTFGAYALGSLAKPLGSVVIGWIGDIYGRKKALRLSMLGIAFPTLILSCIPGHDDLGWIAPFILILCRFAQGFFITGEYDGVRVLIYETMGRDRPFLINNLVGLGAFIGIFLASFAASLLAPINWRWPFWIGGVAGIFVMLSRHALIESEDFLTKEPQQESPFQRHHLRPFLATLLHCGCVGGGYSIFFVYLSSHLSAGLNILSPQEANWMVTQILSCYIPCLIMGAMLADRFGGRTVLRFSVISALFFCQTLIWGDFSIAKLYPLAMALGVMHAPGYVLLLRQFPIAVRYRCTSLGHAMGSMLFSGTAPLTCTYLFQITGWTTIPFMYLTALTILASISVALIQNNRLAKSP